MGFRVAVLLPRCLCDSTLLLTPKAAMAADQIEFLSFCVKGLLFNCIDVISSHL